MLKITKVYPKSVAYQLNIRKGDEIVFFDCNEAVDEYDLIYYESMTDFEATIKRGDERFVVKVSKGEEESFGVEIEQSQKIRTCYNHCIFCFVDQMPEGMRESLYVKDDDYTMSFACGNFVTLTNLSDKDLERLIRLQLSPIYVSVHTMNGQLRKTMLGNRFADKINYQIDKLAKGGISIHCQAVVVPDMNDGKELEYTARKLFEYYPQVCDLAVVPTGITKYREGLYNIPDITRESAREVVELCDRLNGEFGTNFILPADEYFIRADIPVKDYSFYGEFEQIENGIGMTAKFTHDFLDALEDNVTLKKKKKILIISGVSAAKVNGSLCDVANEKTKGLDLRVLPVKNVFFGETVTCTGLLTGKDISDAINEYPEEVDEIVIFGHTMKEFEDVFLDGMTLRQLIKNTKKKVYVNRGGGFSLARHVQGK